VNFDCSTLWVRDRKRLTEALDITPEFLRNKHSEEGTILRLEKDCPSGGQER
jgi:aromatic-L-amino-acid/L-tryptophan decarboxylase